MKETNMEHFRSEIEAFNYNVGVIDGKVDICSGHNCHKCMCGKSDNCQRTIVEWLMSEYKPEPVLTEREKHFVEFAQKVWLARDKDGELYFYPSKPAKKEDRWGDVGTYISFKFFGDSLFHFITWEDEEPWSIEKLRKLKVK